MKIVKIILLLILLGIVAAAYAYRTYVRPIDMGNRTVSIIIEPGNTLTDVARQLLDRKVIMSRAMFVYPARYRGIDKQLKPGRYDFSGKNSCRSILDRLAQADYVKIKVTIPEGITIWEVALILAEKMQLDSAAIVALNSDSVFLSHYGLPSLEGYLFPETYFFRWGMDERSIVGEVLEMFRHQTDSLWPDRIAGGLTRDDIIKLASIIESETRLNSERAVVSSVYHNRLNSRMTLDADPTVVYGLGGLTRPLNRRDLRQDTPYNTYLHRGLPPTPINSPGLAAIRAALAPQQTDFLFFVADETGGHYFSRTNEEHNRAKERIKRLRQLQTTGSG